MQVKIATTDITTIEFLVEKEKPVAETCQALASEIIKSGLVPENRRETIEKYLHEIIGRLLSGKLTNTESDEKPSVKWNGCRRLEDDSMEVEVDINSVRKGSNYLKELLLIFKGLLILFWHCQLLRQLNYRAL